MKTLEKILNVYLAILFIAMFLVGFLFVLYGNTLSFENFSYPVLPTSDMEDIILRVGGFIVVVMLLYHVFKKNIVLDIGSQGYYM